MAKITGATLAPIYERLNGAPSYHPLEADTFADWSVEAGDIVTITRDGKSYDSPVHNSTMTWRKGQKIAISSTGNEKRDSVAKLSQRKYNRGSSGIRNSQSMFQHIETSYNGMTAGLMLASSSAALYVNNKYTQMQSGLFLTESSAHLYTENKYSQMSSGLKLTESSAHLYTNNKYTQMSSGLKLTESSAHLYTNNKYTQMSSGLSLTSSSAALYVDNKYRQMQSGLKLTESAARLYVENKTTKAELILAINGDGQSSAKLKADVIDIDGVVNKLTSYDVRTSGLETTYLNLEGPMLVDDYVGLENDHGTYLWKNFIVSAWTEQDGTELHLMNAQNQEITFRKAASGELDDTTYWGSGTSRSSGTYHQVKYRTKDGSGGDVEAYYNFFTLDKASRVIRVWKDYNSGMDAFSTQLYYIDCDSMVPSHSIRVSEIEDAGGSGYFYGKLYFADGSAVSGSNHYWYYSGNSIGTAQKDVYYD